ncbi:TPA: cysteine--tRNA ligase [Candidatus Woesearchaeota archaeon]|nr:cysteine--tRNA ligase [Candidatus Woesearchaeota archaeon]
MALRVFNSLTKEKEFFQPVKQGEVSIYVCGPTVYDLGHMGHARSAIAFDVIRRYLTWKGLKVTFVSNYTDVDDKIINRAREEKTAERELAERMILEYKKDYKALGILDADIHPKATEHIKEMLDLIKQLEKKGFTYVIKNDGVYYDVTKFRSYGKLSKQKLEDLRAGARVEVDDQKKHPFDFALWKFKKEGEIFWDSSWGKGRPGWHIECSAMSAKHLGKTGKTFDIHGGGIDLIFPHHENEIAQSEGAYEKPMAKYWLHNGHVMVDHEKMSKSLGNFFTIREVLKKYHPKVVRYFLLSTHYRGPINFSNAVLDQAKAGLMRIWDFLEVMRGYENEKRKENKTVDVFIETTRKGFTEAMDDDFDSSGALGYLFDFMREINTLRAKNMMATADSIKVLDFMMDMNNILNVMEKEKNPLDEQAKKMIQERETARKKRDFERADQIRRELNAMGIVLEDTPKGPRWKRKI